MKSIPCIALALTLLPALAAGAPATVKLDVNLGQPKVRAIDGKTTAYLKVGLTGSKIAREGERAPVNLAVVLDRSGSMGGRKMTDAKNAALRVLERLGANDRLSIIAYDHTVEVVAPSMAINDANRRWIAERIRGLSPRGDTALFAGVSAGLAQVRSQKDGDFVNRVILLSDGQANVGPSSPAELARLGASARREGISVTTMGLGLGYNEDLMVALAENSDGNHAFVESSRALAKIFDYELGDVLSVVGQEVVVKVRLDEGVKPVRVLNRKAEIYGDTVVLGLNQLYAGQHKYFLIEVELPPGKVGQTKPVAQVNVSFADMHSKQTVRLASLAKVEYVASARAVQENENRSVLVDAAESVAVLANKLAITLRDQGKKAEAQKVLVDNAAFLKKKARKLKSKKLDTYRQSNVDFADEVVKDDRKWNRSRKSARKQQYELNSQQSY